MFCLLFLTGMNFEATNCPYTTFSVWPWRRLLWVPTTAIGILSKHKPWWFCFLYHAEEWPLSLGKRLLEIEQKKVSGLVFFSGLHFFWGLWIFPFDFLQDFDFFFKFFFLTFWLHPWVAINHFNNNAFQLHQSWVWRGCQTVLIRKAWVDEIIHPLATDLHLKIWL